MSFYQDTPMTADRARLIAQTSLELAMTYLDTSRHDKDLNHAKFYLSQAAYWRAKAKELS